MDQPKLIYFELRGRAEPIRLFLHAIPIDFHDERIVTVEAWVALKPSLPFGKLPTYDVGGTRLCESHAILRHLGRTLIVAKQTEETNTSLDVVQEFLAETQEDLWRFNWLPNYYELLEGYATNSLKPRLERLSGCLRQGPAEGGESWFGPSFSHVDCLAFCLLDEIDAFFPTILREVEELADFHSRVASRAGISSYLSSEARPMVFGMRSMGPKVDARLEFEHDDVFESPWSETINLEVAVARQRRY